METNILTLPPILKLKLDLTSEQFWQLCQENHDLDLNARTQES